MMYDPQGEQGRDRRRVSFLLFPRRLDILRPGPHSRSRREMTDLTVNFPDPLENTLIPYSWRLARRRKQPFTKITLLGISVISDPLCPENEFKITSGAQRAGDVRYDT